jgi:single-strand DNA-binding protein
MINQWVGIGNVTKDFEVKDIGETKLVNFRIAVNDRKDDDNTLFLNVTAFGKLAELSAQFLGRGSKVGIVGRLQIRKKEDKEYTEVVAEKIEFLTPKETDPYDFI